MVRCADCGFLAVRNWQTRALAETESLMRHEGEAPPIFNTPGSAFYERTPICFVRAWDLPEEAGALDNKAAFLRVVQHERVCAAYTPWQQGFTPREHREMLDVSAL